jgi:hypothetical protein
MNTKTRSSRPAITGAGVRKARLVLSTLVFLFMFFYHGACGFAADLTGIYDSFKSGRLIETIYDLAHGTRTISVWLTIPVSQVGDTISWTNPDGLPRTGTITV